MQKTAKGQITIAVVEDGKDGEAGARANLLIDSVWKDKAAFTASGDHYNMGATGWIDYHQSRQWLTETFGNGYPILQCKNTTAQAGKSLALWGTNGKVETPILPNTYYTLSVWVRGSGTTKIGIGANGESTTYCGTVTLSSTWQRISVTRQTSTITNLNLYLAVSDANPHTVEMACMKLEEGDTMTDWCLSETEKKGTDGQSGTSPFVLDLANEMTSVVTDANGVVKNSSGVTVTTAVRAYDGVNDITEQFNVPNPNATSDADRNPTNKVIVSAPGGITATYNQSNKQLSVRIPKDTNIGNGVEVSITFDKGGTQRTAVFSIAAAKPGADGQDALIYELKPSMDSVVFNKSTSSTTTLESDNKTLYVQLRQTNGIRQSVINVSDDFVVRYDTSASPASQNEGTLYVHANGISVSSSHTAVYLSLFRKEATTPPTYTLIDKETVPVIKGGVDGVKGKVYKPEFNDSTHKVTWTPQDGSASESSVDFDMPYVVAGGTNQVLVKVGSTTVGTLIGAKGDDGADGKDGTRANILPNTHFNGGTISPYDANNLGTNPELNFDTKYGKYNALRIKANSETSSSQGFGILITVNSLTQELQPNTTYTFSFYAKTATTSTGGKGVYIVEYISDGTYKTILNTQTTFTLWKRYSASFTTGDSIDVKKTIRIYFSYGITSYCYIANLKLEEGDVATDWCMSETEKKGEKGDAGRTPVKGEDYKDGDTFYPSISGGKLIFTTKTPGQVGEAQVVPTISRVAGGVSISLGETNAGTVNDGVSPTVGSVPGGGGIRITDANGTSKDIKISKNGTTTTLDVGGQTANINDGTDGKSVSITSSGNTHTISDANGHSIVLKPRTDGGMEITDGYNGNKIEVKDGEKGADGVGGGGLVNDNLFGYGNQLTVNAYNGAPLDQSTTDESNARPAVHTKNGFAIRLKANNKVYVSVKYDSTGSYFPSNRIYGISGKVTVINDTNATNDSAASFYVRISGYRAASTAAGAADETYYNVSQGAIGHKFTTTKKGNNWEKEFSCVFVLTASSSAVNPEIRFEALKECLVSVTDFKIEDLGECPASDHANFIKDMHCSSFAGLADNDVMKPNLLDNTDRMDDTTKWIIYQGAPEYVDPEKKDDIKQYAGKNLYKVNNFTTSSGTYFIGQNVSTKLEKNKWYTLSFLTKCVNVTRFAADCMYNSGSTYNYQFFADNAVIIRDGSLLRWTGNDAMRAVFSNYLMWKKHTFTFYSNVDSATSSNLSLRFTVTPGTTPKNTVVEICGIKLEQNDHATDWCDVASELPERKMRDIAAIVGEDGAGIVAALDKLAKSDVGITIGGVQFKNSSLRLSGMNSGTLITPDAIIVKETKKDGAKDVVVTATGICGQTNGCSNIGDNGMLQTGTGTSDIRLKQIDNAELGLSVEEIAGAPIFDFRYKPSEDEEPKEGAMEHSGTSAQYWREILPNVVRENSDGYLSMEYAQAAMVAVVSLAREVQELREEIAELKGKR